jgi:hypothetical protein
VTCFDRCTVPVIRCFFRTPGTWVPETSQPEDEAVAVPVEEWLFDPEDGPRYEASLHSLLGAVEVLEEHDGP